MAIVRTHKPYAATARTAGAGASQPAAVARRPTTCSRRCFRIGRTHYEAQYDRLHRLAAAGDARDGAWPSARRSPRSRRSARYGWPLDAGALRAGHPAGRVPRPSATVGQTNPFIRPFAIVEHRPVPRRRAAAADSSVRGGLSTKSRRWAARSAPSARRRRLENARFHTEAPPNLADAQLPDLRGRQPAIAENARLWRCSRWRWPSGNGCFESKYHFYFWRPQSAIPLAGTDGNAATEADGVGRRSCRRRTIPSTRRRTPACNGRPPRRSSRLLRNEEDHLQLHQHGDRHDAGVRVDRRDGQDDRRRLASMAACTTGPRRCTAACSV